MINKMKPRDKIMEKFMTRHSDLFVLTAVGDKKVC